MSRKASMSASPLHPALAGFTLVDESQPNKSSFRQDCLETGFTFQHFSAAGMA